MKKIRVLFAIVTAIAVLCTASMVSLAAAPTIYGHLNGDKDFDICDLVAASVATDFVEAADLNLDDVIDGNDLQIMRLALLNDSGMDYELSFDATGFEN
ncbi:MAG: hypothetical protein J6B93_04380 [Clostridia bacterium]|nr:hypothetical protein [Clostridia bacterium]